MPPLAAGCSASRLASGDDNEAAYALPPTALDDGARWAERGLAVWLPTRDLLLAVRATHKLTEGAP